MKTLFQVWWTYTKTMAERMDYIEPAIVQFRNCLLKFNEGKQPNLS